MAVVHCSKIHEPVVTKEICIYCGNKMEKDFSDYKGVGHDFSSCHQCILLDKLMPLNTTTKEIR